MNAAAAVFAISAAFMLGYGPAYCLTVALRKRRDRRQLARTPQPRAHVEWSRLQAAVAQARADIAAGVIEGTPIYDRMVCEQIEKAEGWVS
jgi:hypothetical protein